VSYNYTNLAATATRLISRFGRTVTHRVEVKSGSDYDPTITNNDTSIIAVIESFTANEIDNTVIQSCDKRILTVTPLSHEDIIIDGSDVYSIVSVETVKPGDTSLVYIAQLRL